MNALTRNTLLIVCLLAGSLGVAQAAPADEVPTVRVSYSDLDLSTPQGTQALYARITAAARTVCPEPDAREMSRFVRNHACRREAVERAVRSVNSPQLAALAASQSKHG